MTDNEFHMLKPNTIVQEHDKTFKIIALGIDGINQLKDLQSNITGKCSDTRLKNMQIKR